MNLYLSALILDRFKNHASQSLEFHEGLNCITGSNGSGKTNILEAIYYLSYCKGYFNMQDVQNIKHDEDYFVVRGEFKKDGVPTRLTCTVQRGHRKKFKRDEKEYERLADHIGSFPVVIISPYDADLIREGSEERRKFMDMVISLDDRSYLMDLLDYNKALSQRNNLLKYFSENRVFDPLQLSIWNEMLSELGMRIHHRRKLFFEEFRDLFVSYQSEVSKGHDMADIGYSSQLLDGEMLPLLEAREKEERMRGHTLVGTHKDDMLMLIDGRPVKRFGSQGQQKSFLIALKLAKFEFIKRKAGFKPLLLLDDIFDKIDDERVAYLVNLVSQDTFGQIFITDTSQERLDRILKESKVDYKRIALGVKEEFIVKN
jgi:DNA replication and repair protein RecF